MNRTALLSCGCDDNLPLCSILTRHSAQEAFGKMHLVLFIRTEQGEVMPSSLVLNEAENLRSD